MSILDLHLVRHSELWKQRELSFLPWSSRLRGNVSGVCIQWQNRKSNTVQVLLGLSAIIETLDDAQHTSPKSLYLIVEL